MKINKKQRNLLLKSDITNEYPWLLKLLMENEKIDLENVLDEFKDEFVNVVPFIIKQGGEEWKGNEDVLNIVEDLGESRKPCSLCNTPNRYIHYIKNRINGNTLNVGSDCVEEFADLDFLQEGKTKGQLLKNARKIRRMSEMNNRFNGIDKIVEGWTRVIDIRCCNTQFYRNSLSFRWKRNKDFI